MKKLILSITLALTILPCLSSAQSVNNEQIKIKIEKITQKTCPKKLQDIQQNCKTLFVKEIEGSKKGTMYTIDMAEFASISQLASDTYEVGQVYFAERSENIDGSDIIMIMEINRLSSLFLLVLIFIFFVILFGGKQGAMSLLGMIISFVILIFLVAKGILSGYNAGFITFISALLIMSATLYPTYGWRKKTHAAMLGSLLSILITFVLSYIFIKMTYLTGFASEESSFLQIADTSIGMKDILFAGIMIGTLGVLDDITIGQASVVFQLAKANKKMPAKEIYKKAIVVGKDHVASMVNTLIIAYAGASFPLFLLFVQEGGSFTYLLNKEIVTEEIVRMMVGSLGILMAVPLTTWIASKMVKKT